MYILSVDTSNKVASVALFNDKNLLNEKFSDDQKTHSEKLLPIIDELLKEENLSIKDIDMFVVSVGPGSFTGIRIGVATVKGMAQALNKKVISVTSLEGLIEMANGENVCAIINARHGNVYAQIKHNNELLEPDCRTIEEVISELKGYNKKFIIVGDATIEFENLLNSELDCEIFEKKIEASSNIAKFALNGFIQNIPYNKSKTVDEVTFTLQNSIRNIETMQTTVIISNASDKVVNVSTSNIQPNILGGNVAKLSTTSSVNLNPGEIGSLTVEYYFQYNSNKEFSGVTISGAKFGDGTIIKDVYISK